MPSALAETPDWKEAIQPSILIVDDQSVSRLILERIIASIEPSARLLSYTNGEDALRQAEVAPPDLVLTDYRMNGMDGIALTCALRAIPSCRDIPIVMITAVEDSEVRYRALEMGATDFLRKPIDPIECRVRCRNLLRIREQQHLVVDRAQLLEVKILEATRDIQKREQDALWTLARAAEYRDEETGNHIIRMAKYSRLIADDLGLPKDECDAIEMAAPMHDIGKIGVPDAILLKRGTHTPEEQTIMRRHTVIGHDILKDSVSKYLRLGATIALGHHERYDGGGYPHGLKGEDIPLPARIVAVADVFDALMSARPYKDPWPADRAMDYVRAALGTQLDPLCGDSFLRQIESVMFIREQFRDETPPELARRRRGN
ncbi:MAG TPA: HD domain-containing phosphohydrolase [Burkholderiales bacterium]|jgi:two-component system response regulator RpfG